MINLVRLPICKLFALLWLVTLAGCASLVSPMDPPKVTVENIRSLPVEGSGPRFLITVRVVNPNEQALDIAGISYEIELMGRELVTGVANDIPLIEGYSEQSIDLEAGVNLFEFLRLLASLGRSPTDVISYKVTAKVDFRGLVPTQRVEKTGEIGVP
ncbi:MAG: LEA type 2 family protein [Halioglobus sp.]